MKAKRKRFKRGQRVVAVLRGFKFVGKYAGCEEDNSPHIHEVTFPSLSHETVSGIKMSGVMFKDSEVFAA